MKSMRLAILALTLAVSGTALAAPQSNGSPAGNDPATGTGNESAQPVSDTWITTKVKAELLATKGVTGTDINVETVNGVVRLSGHVDGKTEADKAVEIARKIDGVKKVDSTGLVSARSAHNK
ncbi:MULTISPECIES: BON domain-containing protein [Lysobacter]|uniref:BON domain-containing protein n=1 Tax=Lysobacter TaxID=68 RepID=UPI0004D03578|nr:MULTISPECIES: BON domain-containing protein [Lysobacter]